MAFTRPEPRLRATPSITNVFSTTTDFRMPTSDEQIQNYMSGNFCALNSTHTYREKEIHELAFESNVRRKDSNCAPLRLKLTSGRQARLSTVDHSQTSIAPSTMIPKRKQKRDLLSRHAARAAGSIRYRADLISILRRAALCTRFARFGYAQTCMDNHRCCQNNNNGEERATHFLCEVMWNLLRGFSKDIFEDGRILIPVADRFGRIIVAVR